jgi:hypothetical protein
MIAAPMGEFCPDTVATALTMDQGKRRPNKVIGITADAIKQNRRPKAPVDHRPIME